MKTNLRGLTSSFVIFGSQMLILLKGFSVAENLIRFWLKKAPDEKPNMLILLGDLYEQIGDHSKAAGCYNEALELEPNEWSHYWNLGCLYESQNENRRAWEYYEKALSLKTDTDKSFDNQIQARIEKLKN